MKWDFFQVSIYTVGSIIKVIKYDLIWGPPKPTFCPKWEVSVNVGLEEG